MDRYKPATNSCAPDGNLNQNLCQYEPATNSSVPGRNLCQYEPATNSSVPNSNLSKGPNSCLPNSNVDPHANLSKGPNCVPNSNVDPHSNLSKGPNSCLPNSNVDPHANLSKGPNCVPNSNVDPHSKLRGGRIGAAIALALLFALGEAAAGALGHSLALLSDAAHLLGDAAALGLALGAHRLGLRPGSPALSYGWRRAEVVGALASALLTWALLAALAAHALGRAAQCARPGGHCIGTNPVVLLQAGSMGLAVNISIALVLASAGHHHHHGPASRLLDRALSYSRLNVNLKAALLHALGDCIQSVGIIIAGIVIYSYNSIYLGRSNPVDNFSLINLIDPLCCIVFSALTIASTIHLLRDVTQILMQGTPAQINFEEIMSRLGEIQYVHSVHDLHIWSVSSEAIVLSVHLVLNGHVYDTEKSSGPDNHGNIPTCQLVLNQARQLCREYNIHHTTIQIDDMSLDNPYCFAPGIQCST